METDFISDDLIVKCIPRKDILSEYNLLRLNSKMDCGEAVSLLFLMCDGDDERLVRVMYDALSETKACGKTKRVEFAKLCRENIQDWDKKIIEALVEVQLFQVLFDVFGISKIDALFNVQSNDRAINCNYTRIYRICDGMDKITKHTFLRCMKKLKPDYMPPLSESCFLEMYFMFWQIIDVINPSTGKGFDILMRCLQEIEAPSLLTLIDGEKNTRLCIDDYTLDTYRIINEEEVGLCVIVNQFDFDNPTNNRASSCFDEKYLTSVMESLKFKVVALQNLTSHEMGPVIKQTIMSQFQKDHSILFLAIMSHGQDGQVMGKDGRYVSVQTIRQGLHETKSLTKIPKVLVICACRGDMVYTAHSIGYYDEDNVKMKTDIMDIVTCFSTIPGFISIRNSNKGSLFMQVFCEVLEKRANLEICEIFTIVNQALMNPKDYRVYNPAKIAHPCEFNSRLLKKLYLMKLPQNR